MKIKEEYLDLPKQDTPGVEESTVVVVECTTVKEEIKEENMDTEDPLSDHGEEFKYILITFYIYIPTQIRVYIQYVFSAECSHKTFPPKNVS